MANQVDHPRTVFLREDRLVAPLDAWQAQEFGALQRRHTITKILDQAAVGMPVPTADMLPSGPTVAELDAKLAQYRATLDAGGDPAVVAGWIAETQAERQLAEARQRLRNEETADRSIVSLNVEQVTSMVDDLGGVTAALASASPDDKLDIYREMGLRLTYLPDAKTVRADLVIDPHRWDSVRVRRGT